MPESTEDLLKEVRDQFQYYENNWNRIREEAKTDMRYCTGDPWSPQDKQARKDAERPMLAMDELAQFTNQLINDPKQNPRAIKINPKGDGATDQTARTREDLIRSIQYNSRAQAAFTTGFQGAVQRSYGFWRVGARYRDDDSFEQELYIGRIPNPDSVLIHPNYKELDASDMMGAFVLDKLNKEEFKQKYPHAEITDFTPDMINLAPQWLQDNEVMVAEYWKVSTEPKKLYLIESKKDGPIILGEDELPKGFDKSRISRERTVLTRKVTQYITNGVEILDKVAIPIPWIPIIPCFGEELWIDDGGGSRRMLFSLIRRARDPFMYYCYIRTTQAEVVGMAPRAPWLAVTGQIKTHEEQWQLSGKIPVTVLQYDQVLDSDGHALPPPTRVPLAIDVQGLEVLAEGARRAIQSAMGINPLPTAAQRQNQKSGVALQQIESQEDRGSFTFVDNLNASLEHTGRILDAWIPKVYDVDMDVAVQRPDESQQVIRINDPAFEEPDDNGQPVKTHYDTVTGNHGVTVSVGPSFESQRAEAGAFVDTVVSNIAELPIDPQAKAKILSLAVKLKNIGPLGDEMADIISPPPDKQAQQQAIAQGQMQLQQSQQIIQEMQAEIQKLQLEKAGKVIQGETQKQIQQMKNDIDVLKALLASKQAVAGQEAEMYKTFWVENHGAAHEAAMQATQQQHDAQQQQAAAATQAQQSQQDHGQALVQQAATQSPEAAQQ